MGIAASFTALDNPPPLPFRFFPGSGGGSPNPRSFLRSSDALLNLGQIAWCLCLESFVTPSPWNEYPS